MNANDIGMLILISMGSIAGIIWVCGMFSDEIVKIIRALRGQDDDE